MPKLKYKEIVCQILVLSNNKCFMLVGYFWSAYLELRYVISYNNPIVDRAHVFITLGEFPLKIPGAHVATEANKKAYNLNMKYLN